MRDKIGDRQRLLHISDAIAELRDYTNGVSASDFLTNSMMRFACVKQLEIIGEASNYITSELKSKYPEVEWRKMIGMRHILVHEYFGIDFNLAWQVIVQDLNALDEQVNKVLKSL